MIVPQLRINSERLLSDFEELAQIGITANNGVCRLALSREDLEARAWFADKIEEAGFFVHDDDAGNLGGVLHSDTPGAKTLLIGSHLDTVPDSGRYEGTLGVLAALECLRIIHEAALKLPVHLEVIDFTDDEGTWEPLFGSRSLTGRLNSSYLMDTTSDSSEFRAALTMAGINPKDIYKACRDSEAIRGYIELHIEQGWRLERASKDIGVVTSVVSRAASRVTFHGQAGHSGTASMRDRRDALQGAALFITRAHELIRENYPDGVFNCGKLNVKPATLTVIPSQVELMLEYRHVNEAQLDNMEKSLMGLAQECAHSCRLIAEFDPVNHIPAALMAYSMIDAIEQACDTVGVSHLRLASYASHDAQVMSAFTPSGMIFIPSVSGVSHHPDELSNWHDVVNGTNVLLHTILKVALGG